MRDNDHDAPLRLWEVDHPYYCSESNYYSNEPGSTYASWGEFLESEGDNDMDLNLVFRWDWTPNEYVEEADLPGYHARFDDNYRAYTLRVFWMGQRKGLFRCTEVSVCRADEPGAREWLTERWKHMEKLWAPMAHTDDLGQAG